MGPGAIIGVAYVDPDNYQTAISAGASFQYKLLFIILVTNLIGIYLQVLRSLSLPAPLSPSGHVAYCIVRSPWP
jgi:NRAMP (natural resistance-associated macrophage protein)-like metal ion transporter